MKIGVFDSGVGGLSVAQAIEKALPENEIIFRDDRLHVPYGSRQPDEIFGFVVPIFENLIGAGCSVIVVACNTVTTTLIDRLRLHFADTPLIGVEPMVKSAAERTKSGVVAVYATSTTLASPRYKWLKENYAPDIKVLEPDCNDWSSMIESNKIDHEKISARTSEVLDQGADVIVLGCTHYHWIETEIKELAAGKATVLQPEAALVEQLKQVLQQLD
ncbi:MAG TPA: glutamate racemase [Candidatus Saccharimonadales bacterium]|nr:glutamate racemase [Candidatus Saccharimonadales bacterium]